MNFHYQRSRSEIYTGLPNFPILMALFNFLAPCVENGNRSVLSSFQQMMVVLMKLRFNLGNQDIGFRFGVNQSTVSRCFSEWIDVMYIRLKPLIKWPERDELMKTMPMDFGKISDSVLQSLNASKYLWRDLLM